MLAVTTLDISPSIGNLTVGSYNTLNTNESTLLTVNGSSIINAGAININSTGGYTDLILSPTGGTVTLSGAGTLTLSNSPYNRIYSTAGGTSTLVNQSTIQGSGQFGINNGGYAFALNNQGTVDADQSVALQVNPTGAITNSGTFEATNGGTLDLTGTVANSGGKLLSSGTGSLVDFSGSAINGGALTTTGGGVLQNSGLATLNGVTVSGGATLTLVNGSTTVLQGTITNNGNIAENSTGAYTNIQLSGPVTLTSPGTLTMSNSPYNRIYGITSNASLLNSAGSTIQGSGQLGINNGGFAFTLNNQGIVDANQSAALQVAPTGAITNGGTFEATGGGTLDLMGTVANGGGTILSTGANSLVEVSGSTITGGLLTTASGGTLQNSGAATFNGVTITGGSTLTLSNASDTTLQGTITNNGNIAENGTGAYTNILLNGSVTLTAPGTLTMSDSYYNRIYGSTGSDSLLNSAGSTIQGAGQIGINNGGYAFTLNNQGIINANQINTLLVAPTITVTNTGTLEATAGGTLVLTGGAFNNTGGAILSSGSGSLVDVSGATINGGVLTTTGGGTLRNAATATFNGVTISGGSTLTLTNGSDTTLQGTITNNGTIAENSTGAYTNIHLGGAVSLTGPGSLTMSNSFYNRIYGSGSDSLLIGAGSTIQGAGEIGVNNGGYAFALNNQGTIDANQTNTLQVAPSTAVTNTGIMEATAGGTLSLTGGAFNNAGGTILSTGAGSTVQISGSTINGGILTTTSGGLLVNSGTATVNGVTISGGSTLTLANGSATTLQGTIVNNGTILQNSTGAYTNLYIYSPVTLNGTGSLTLSNNSANRVYGNGSGVLTNGVNHTIQGSGQLGINAGGYGFTLINNGTIIANQSVALQVAPGSVTNNGTLAVAAGSTMHVQMGFTNFSAGTLTGGTYLVTGGVGTPGTLQIDALGNTIGGGEIVNNASNIVLTGPTAQITDANNVDALTQFQDNLSTGSFTVQGGQLFSTNLTDGDSFTNAGAVDVGALSSFTTGGDYTQTAGTTQVDGTLTANGNQVSINGGTLLGMGTVKANVTIAVNGTITGDPADFNIIGTYIQPGTYEEQIASASAFDQLDITGTANVVGGNLDLLLLSGYLPGAGTSFVILDALGGVSGQYATAGGVAIVNDQFTAYGQEFSLDYTTNPDEIILDADGPLGGGGGTATPEPSAYVPIMVAAAEVLRRKVMKRRKA